MAAGYNYHYFWNYDAADLKKISTQDSSIGKKLKFFEDFKKNAPKIGQIPEKRWSESRAPRSIYDAIFDS